MRGRWRYSKHDLLKLNKHILTLTICFTLASCREEDRFINGKYEGLWADTFWTYEFKHNGQFIFKSEGHYGDVTDYGFYLVKDSLLLLNPRTDWHVLDGVLKTRLKMVNGNCLRDFESNYYCLSIDATNRFIDDEIAFQDRVIAIGDTLQFVKEEKERMASYHSTDEQLAFEIDYSGIIMIDNKEFHQFDLVRYDMRDGRRNYLTFLATKEPFEIFQHNSAGNRLSLIYKE